MAKYINTSKDNVKSLNAKQTVIVENTSAEDGKKVRNIYLGNFKRRQDAYYEGMVPAGMKASRKTGTSYRLLKLGKLLAEVSVKGYNTKTNYFITENYDNDTPVVRAVAEAAEAPAEVETPTEAAVVAE